MGPRLMMLFHALRIYLGRSMDGNVNVDAEPDTHSKDI